MEELDSTLNPLEEQDQLNALDTGAQTPQQPVEQLSSPSPISSVLSSVN